jgi:hypothetical protein
MNGRPHNRVFLELHPRFDWNYTSWSATINEEGDGNFQFKGLKPGRYSAIVMDRTLRNELLRLPDIEITETRHEDLTVTLSGTTP